MNVLAYIIYILLTYLITVHVGWRFYTNGRVYILNLLQGDEAFTDFINRLLLVGYYLLNLGYAALMISLWDTIHTWLQLLESLFFMTGRILLTLAIINYINMSVILWLSQKRQTISTPKNQTI